MSSNCLIFHTSGGISSSTAAFLFLIFLSTESSSSWVKGPSLMSNCLLILLVIGSCVTFGGFLSKFLKCCFHRCICSCWLVVFSLAFTVFFLLLTSFTICHAILDCLSSTEFLILSIWFCMYSVCSFRYMLPNSFCAFLSFRALVLVGFFLLHLEAVFTSACFSLTTNVVYLCFSIVCGCVGPFCLTSCVGWIYGLCFYQFGQSCLRQWREHCVLGCYEWRSIAQKAMRSVSSLTWVGL